MSILGGALFAGGSLLGGLFGGQDRRLPQNYWLDRALHQQVYGAPMPDSPEARRIFQNYYDRGSLVSPEGLAAQGGSYRDQVNRALESFTGNLTSLYDNYESGLGGNRGDFRSLAGEVSRRSGEAATRLRSAYSGALSDIGNRTQSIIDEADRFGQGREDAIRRDYRDAMGGEIGRALAGSLSSGYSRGTTAAANASLAAERVLRARDSALLDASESASDRRMGARQYATDAMASLYRMAPDVESAANEYGFRDIPLLSQNLTINRGDMAQLLGLRTSLEETRLGRLAPAGLFYPDPYPQGGGEYSVPSNPGLAGVGNALGGIGSFLLGNSLYGQGNAGNEVATNPFLNSQFLPSTYDFSGSRYRDIWRGI